MQVIKLSCCFCATGRCGGKVVDVAAPAVEVEAFDVLVEPIVFAFVLLVVAVAEVVDVAVPAVVVEAFDVVDDLFR